MWEVLGLNLWVCKLCLPKKVLLFCPLTCIVYLPFSRFLNIYGFAFICRNSTFPNKTHILWSPNLIQEDKPPLCSSTNCFNLALTICIELSKVFFFIVTCIRPKLVALIGEKGVCEAAWQELFLEKRLNREKHENEHRRLFCSCDSKNSGIC